jgi:flagellar biogenesis protein FliO
MESIQQTLSVLLVLALLGGTLWWLRRKGMAHFAFKSAGVGKRKSIQILERTALTPQHSLHLVKLEDRTMLIAASPGGCSILSERVENR